MTLRTITFPALSFAVLALVLSPAAKPMEYICYSPYRNGQEPGGAEPTEAQIQEDFRILAPFVRGIRTYSSQGIHAQIPKLAQAAGLEVWMGAWIGKDDNANRAQVNALIQLAKGGNPAIKGLIVGNEVLLRKDVTKERLVEFLRQVKDAGTGIPVTTADIYQRIGEFSADLAPVVDVVMCHVHPFWENQAIGNAANHVLNGYKSVVAKYPGKKVIVGETGFPSAGQTRGGAVPSAENQAKFAYDLTLLGRRENMTFMFFTSFDEEWKGAEGPVGANWGIWTTGRAEKPAVARVRSIPTAIRLDRSAGGPLRVAPAAAAGAAGTDALGRLRAAVAGPAGIPARALPVWTVGRP